MLRHISSPRDMRRAHGMLLIFFKEHNHVFARAQDFYFWTGCRELTDARINIKLLQIRVYRPQCRSRSTLALP